MTQGQAEQGPRSTEAGALSNTDNEMRTTPAAPPTTSSSPNEEKEHLNNSMMNHDATPSAPETSYHDYHDSHIHMIDPEDDISATARSYHSGSGGAHQHARSQQSYSSSSGGAQNNSSGQNQNSFMGCYQVDRHEWEEMYDMAVCHAGEGLFPLSGCSIEEQFGMLTHCRTPDALLSLFGRPVDERDPSSEDYTSNFPAASGFHAIPKTCEYCGSESTDYCSQNTNCQRPKSFFRKQRPPFAAKGPEWDPQTDYYIAPPPAVTLSTSSSSPQNKNDPNDHQERRSSLQWVTDMFQSQSNGSIEAKIVS